MPSAAATPRGGAGRIRAVTWNIRAAIGPGEPFPPAWWRHVRRDRLERIAAIIAALEPDVVTLQEVTIMNADGEVHDQPADLARLTGLQATYGAVHAFPLVEPDTGRTIGAASWGNAILSPSPLRDRFVTGLPRAADNDLVEPPDAGHPFAGVRYADAEPGHREGRCAVGGRLEVASAGGSTDGTDGGVGSPVAVVTAHLTYIGRSQRASQAAAVASMANDLAADSAGPAIVAGDFNAPLDAPELAAIAGSFHDGFAVIGLAPGDPRRRTCASAAIDHVLTRGLTVVGCRVAREAGDASDHLPVVAELVVPSEPAD